MIRLIAAVDEKLGIAKDGEMPWSIPEDEAYFTERTQKFGGRVLTAGKTFREAYKSQPLKNRTNYIYTRRSDPIEGATVINDLNKFLADNSSQDLWVAGGGELFTIVIQKNLPIELYLTHIKGDFDCDTFFPAYTGFKLVKKSDIQQQNGFEFYYAIYTNQ